jgi:hypothetical protein
MSDHFWLLILLVFTSGFVAGIALTVLYFKRFEIPRIEEEVWRAGERNGAVHGCNLGWDNHARGLPSNHGIEILHHKYHEDHE